MLADVRSGTQTFGCQFPTVATALRGIARINPADFTTSTFSLVLKDVQERCPPRVQNAFTQSPILDHTLNVQVFHHNQSVPERIAVRYLEVKVPALAFNLHVRSCHIPSGLLASVTAFLPTTHDALFAPQGALRRAKKARVLNRVPVAIRQKRRQAHIKADSGTIIVSWHTGNRGQVAYNQRIPVRVGTLDEVHRFRRAFKGTMQLDLDACTKFLRHNQMPSIDTHIITRAVLSQLKRVPLVRSFESRKPNARAAVRLSFGAMVQKELQRLCQPIRDGLQGCCWRMRSSRASKHFVEIVLVRKRLSLAVLRFRRCKHGIIRLPRFNQTLLQAIPLIGGWVQSLRIRSHTMESITFLLFPVGLYRIHLPPKVSSPLRSFL